MVLVTGATGFLGSELICQLVKRNIKVRAIKRNNSSIPSIIEASLIEWVNGDVLDYFSLEEALIGVTQVYHCAAFISFNKADKKRMHQVNAEGTANLVNLCTEKNVRLLHVSSVAAISEGKAGHPITEKDFWDFNGSQNAYSISKYEAEMEVWRGIAEGLSAVIVNPSLIIGKGAGKNGSGALFETVKNGLKFYTSGAFGFVDVEDVAKAMILLMESVISGQRYLINAENLSYRDIFIQAAAEFNISPPTLEAKPWMLKIASITAGISSGLTGIKNELAADTIKSAFKNLAYSSLKFKNEFPDFNFKPINLSIKEVCKADEY